MGVFRFKQFSVRNDRSAMRVNTDGVLLGALMSVRVSDGLSLDVGTGTGTVALMAAQRLFAGAEPRLECESETRQGRGLTCESGAEPERGLTCESGAEPVRVPACESGSEPVRVPACESGAEPVRGLVGESGAESVRGLVGESRPEPVRVPACESRPEPVRADERRILAIEIDGQSAEEAAENFCDSPWAAHLEARHISLQEFIGLRTQPETQSALQFDHIFSNPPYFDETLRSPDLRRRTARHSETLSYREIIDFAASSLAENGLLSLILPTAAETDLCRHARMSGLFPLRIIRIRTTERKPASRIIAEFSRLRQIPSETVFTIHSGNGFSEEYIAATSAFYLNF